MFEHRPSETCSSVLTAAHMFMSFKLRCSKDIIYNNDGA